MDRSNIIMWEDREHATRKVGVGATVVTQGCLQQTHSQPQSL